MLVVITETGIVQSPQVWSQPPPTFLLGDGGPATKQPGKLVLNQEMHLPFPVLLLDCQEVPAGLLVTAVHLEWE